MTRTPHNPRGGSCESAGKGQHLNASVVAERGQRDDAVLDGACSSGTDRDRSNQFENRAKDHGLAIGDGSRRDAGCPGVCYIVYGASQ